jgi:hypothetical protein
MDESHHQRVDAMSRRSQHRQCTSAVDSSCRDDHSGQQRREPAGTRGCATLPDLEDAIQAARDSLAQVPACP